ncbi:unnamed protein product [Pleuronectes platessa]|uniref:Uncharacterized protein n=1 Tax=Pleuronectes platessa TaxID=8262 RepID=A0A9N7YLQ8_PLEPL|nr:unnamed protein product [Pleuronectes platessa]
MKRLCTPWDVDLSPQWNSLPHVAPRRHSLLRVYQDPPEPGNRPIDSTEVCKTEGECCIIHECVPPCAWTAVTRSCQQCILERDGTGRAEDTLRGPLASGGLWEGPGNGSLHGFVPVTPEAEAPRCAKAASRCFSLRCDWHKVLTWEWMRASCYLRLGAALKRPV